MKYLVVSDIHGNIDALEAVLTAELPRADAVLCLGDTVGYGPEPALCVGRLSSLEKSGFPLTVIRGNHDAAVCGSLSTEWFNPHARFAVDFTRKMLGPSEIDWLSRLPDSVGLPGSCLAVHGSPLEPLTGYLFGGPETRLALETLSERSVSLCFTGHTHTPAWFTLEAGKTVLCPRNGERYSLSEMISRADDAARRPLPAGLRTMPCVANPGSLGFPRSLSGDEPLERYPAEYALWDTETMTVTFKVAEYDRGPTEARLEDLYRSVE